MLVFGLHFIGVGINQTEDVWPNQCESQTIFLNRKREHFLWVSLAKKIIGLIGHLVP